MRSKRRKCVGLLAILVALATIYHVFTCCDVTSTQVVELNLRSAREASQMTSSSRPGVTPLPNVFVTPLRYDPWLTSADHEMSELGAVIRASSSQIKYTEYSGKMFLYVTQTEECLPRHFLRSDQLGEDGEAFEFLVLSWKHECTDRRQHYSNVKYIFPGRNTSWSTGRNLLFSLIKRNTQEYLYYIFMDDDLMLNYTRPNQVYFKKSYYFNGYLQDMASRKHHRFHNQNSVGNPYRDFEKFLEKYSPAVGLLNFCYDERDDCLTSYYPDIWDSFCRKEGPVPYPYLSYSMFDGAINAFHRDAISHILPYHVTYEAVNWQESQKYLILLADIKFQGQVLYNMNIMGYGLLHRPYPRKIHFHQNWEKVLEDLRPHIDPKYWNEQEVLPLKVSRRRFDEIRNPLPPRSPIIPYRHYRLNRTRSCHYRSNMYGTYNNV